VLCQRQNDVSVIGLVNDLRGHQTRMCSFLSKNSTDDFNALSDSLHLTKQLGVELAFLECNIVL